MPNMIPVNSSNLKSVGYDEAESILYVEFKANTLYEYYDVPSEVYEELLKAESKGKYYNAEIKTKYRVSKIR